MLLLLVLLLLVAMFDDITMLLLLVLLLVSMFEICNESTRSSFVVSRWVVANSSEWWELVSTGASRRFV